MTALTLREPRAEWEEQEGNPDMQFPPFPGSPSVQVPQAPSGGEQAVEVSHPLCSPGLTYSLPTAS